jgi:hypothetical protein
MSHISLDIAPSGLERREMTSIRSAAETSCILSDNRVYLPILSKQDDGN